MQCETKPLKVGFKNKNKNKNEGVSRTPIPTLKSKVQKLKPLHFMQRVTKAWTHLNKRGKQTKINNKGHDSRGYSSQTDILKKNKNPSGVKGTNYSR